MAFDLLTELIILWRLLLLCMVYGEVWGQKWPVVGVSTAADEVAAEFMWLKIIQLLQ